MEEDLQEDLLLGSPSVCERRPVVHRSPKRGPLVDPIPSPLLPFMETPPPNLNRGLLGVGMFSGVGLLSSSTSKPIARTRAISSARFCALKTKSAIGLFCSFRMTGAAAVVASGSPP